MPYQSEWTPQRYIKRLRAALLGWNLQRPAGLSAGEKTKQGKGEEVPEMGGGL